MCMSKNNRDNIKILVCCHKPYNLPDNPIYLTIHVGKAVSLLDLCIQGDNECNEQACDNISKLNSLYSEMTAMYWAWKNIQICYPDVQYVGLCHYRRYFCAENHVIQNLFKQFVKTVIVMKRVATGHKLGIYIHEKRQEMDSLNNERFFRSNKKLKDIICSYDITTTYPIRLYNNDVRTFFSVVGREYISLLEEIVASQFPEYQCSLQKILDGSRLISANMLVIKIGYLDEYCRFVFGVLEKHIEEVKKQNICNEPKLERVYSRVPGYMAEVLTNTFIEKQRKKLKIAYTEKFFIEQ